MQLTTTQPDTKIATLQLYRYEDQTYSTVSIGVGGNESYGTTEPVIELRTYKVLKETPHGYWIDWTFLLHDRKWVSKTSRKRFAHPTIEEAKESFLTRKKYQLRIYAAKVRRIEKVITLANEGKYGT